MSDELNVRYTETGRAVHLVESLNHGGFVVQEIIEDGETGEEYVSDKMRIVHQLFTSPPLEKYHADIEAATERLSALRQEAAELTKTVHEARQEQRDNLARIEDATAIRDIDRVLRGEAEWIVVEEYSMPSIIKASEATYKTSGYSSENGKLRALMLCFTRETRERRRPRLYWWLSRYSDCSGDSEPCTIHFDYESARAKAQELIDDSFKRNPNQGVNDWMIERAAKHNLTLPPDKLEEHRAFKITQAQKAAADSRADAEKAEAELARITTQETPCTD